MTVGARQAGPKRLLKALLPVVDILCAPFTLLSALTFKLIRRAGLGRMKLSKKILMTIGVFPIRDHYFEPLFNPTQLTAPLDLDRQLPAIDLNVEKQLSLLREFDYNDELRRFPLEPGNAGEFYYHNGAFEAGDAEYLYSVVRFFKPRRIIEIDSGYSTLMAAGALKANKHENPAYEFEHVCIEPYEHMWLEEVGVTVIRKKVEEFPLSLFEKLEGNDILFIDSSHVIRPQGDVLREHLEIIPAVGPGVLVHVHDIFTPKDYPEEWIVGEMRFWNEQYLLEAFLSFNRDFRVIGALNYLSHHHRAELERVCPVLRDEPHREPGSFWFQRNEGSVAESGGLKRRDLRKGG